MNKNLIFNIIAVIGAAAVPILALFGWQDFHPDPQWAALAGAIIPALLAIIRTIQHSQATQQLDVVSRDLETERAYGEHRDLYIQKLESKFVAPHGLGVKVDPATQEPPTVTFVPFEQTVQRTASPPDWMRPGNPIPSNLTAGDVEKEVRRLVGEDPQKDSAA